ncbi:MAG: glutathione S-transferase family protein, partial [Sphingopyxis sp.]
MSLIFYTNPMSRGQIARWMLEEVGAEYEQRLLGYDGAMKDASFSAINPMGKVPAIVHNGHVVTECAAICAYLAAAFPAAGLGPLPGEAAHYYRWLFFAAGPVEQAVVARAMGWTAPDPAREKMLGFGNFELTIETLSAHVAANAYVCGDRFTAADVYVGSQILWGLDFGSIPSNERLVAYAERLRPRPAYLRAKSIDNALIAQQTP